MSGYRMLRMIVAFGVGILVARYLGPELYGQLSYSVALIMLFLGVAGPGMKDVITQKLDDPAFSIPEVLRASFRLMLGMNLILLTAALLVTLLLRPGEQIIWVMVAVIGLGNVFRAFESYELLFLYRLQMARTVTVQAVSFFTISALKLLLIWYGAGVVLFAVVVGTELVITGIGFWWLYRRDRSRTGESEGKPVPFSLEKRILKTSLPAIGGLAFTLLLFKADQVMLGWLASDAEVGRYAIAVQFSEYWIYLAAALVTSTYPNLLEAFRRSEAEFSRQFSRLCAVLLYGGVAVAIPVWLLGEWIILLFLGDAFAGSAVILGVHIWSVFFLFMLEAMKKYYVIKSVLPFYVKVTFLAAAINIGLNIWLIPVYGGVGAAWATVISYSIAGFWGLLLFPQTRKAALLMMKSLLEPVHWMRGK